MKRVLFICYYYPPSAGSGVQRSLKFSRYLPHFGWKPTILTVDPLHAAYPGTDDDLLQQVPADVEIVRTRSWDPYNAYAALLNQEKSETVGIDFAGEGIPNRRQRLGRWLRANVFIPDARVGWVPFATRRAKDLLQKQEYDAVFTTGPPHSSHLIGRALHRRFDSIPWIADLRDPWTGISYYSEMPVGPLALRRDKKYERSVLMEATRVITVGPTMADQLREIVQREYDVIFNGFDPSDFPDEPVRSSSEEMIVRHVGVASKTRNPDCLWKALRDNPRLPGLRVELVGKSDEFLVREAQEHEIGDLVTVKPYVEHEQAIKEMRTASILLLLINNIPGAESIATGKIYEYLASRRPILGVGPVPGDAHDIIATANAGQMFGYKDSDGVYSFLKGAHGRWENGALSAPASEDQLRPFSRITQAQQLANLLDDVTGKS